MNLLSHWSFSDSMGQSTAFQIASSGGPVFETADASLTLASVDGSQTSAPAPFLTKTYDMVDDSATDAVVSWSTSGNSFVVWNHPEFSRDLLPKYFKHSNFSSFVRQLNTYGFRKVDPEKWEFANDEFLQGKRQLLKNIHRRKPAPHPQPPQGQGTFVEVGKFGLEQEVERLKRDKSVLMMELVRLRQQQQQTERELQLMGQRFHIREQSQQKMISFFARALKNPSFFAKLVEQNEQLSTPRKKRRLSTSEENESESSQPESSIGFEMVRYQPDASGTGRVINSKTLNPTGGASKIEKLDLMFENFEHLEAESRQESDESPRSGVSLIETHTSTSLAEVAPDCKLNNFSIESRLTSPSISSLNSPKTKSKTGTLIPDNLETGGFIESIELSLATMVGPAHLSSKGRSTDEVSKSEDAAAFASNTVVRSGENNGFWNQFLTGSPGSHNSETKVDANTSEVS